MDGYSFQAQVNRISPVGLVPEGLRIDVGFAGTLTDGQLRGAAIDGVDYLLIRPDGVAVIDARELITAPDGSNVSVRAEGYVVAPFEMPELSVLSDPSFTWPDVELPLHGSARLQSAASGLEAVNRAVYSFEGSVNMARGSLVVRARRITAEGAHPHVALLAQGYAAFAAGDIPAVTALFDPEIAWHVPGDNPVAGDYKGSDEVRGFFDQLIKRSGGTFHLEIADILAGDTHAAALVTEHASAGPAELRASAVHVWRVVDGKLSEFTDHYSDQAAVDDFWTQA